MTAEKVLSAYIDLNIVLLTVAAIWLVSRVLISRTSLRIAFLSQLRLLYGVLALFILSPLIVLLSGAIQNFGLLQRSPGLGLSDFLLAQYLHGNIVMAPSQFEQVLMLRSDLTHDIASLASTTSYVVLGAFSLGALLSLTLIARNVVRVTTLIRGSYVLRRIGRIDVRMTDQALVPFSTRDLWRHYIVLPSHLLAQSSDARIAVSHELQHIRQKDLVWEIALEFLRPLFFWNPAFRFCKKEVERMRELACDQQVTARGIHPLRAYCDCLLRVCHTSLAQDRRNQIITPTVPFAQVDAAPGGAHSIRFLKQRVVSMLDGRGARPSRWRGLFLGVPLAAVIGALMLTSTPSTDWTQDRLMLSTIVNLERLNSRTITP